LHLHREHLDGDRLTSTVTIVPTEQGVQQTKTGKTAKEKRFKKQSLGNFRQLLANYCLTQ
jgi:hypothetical protein